MAQNTKQQVGANLIALEKEIEINAIHQAIIMLEADGLAFDVLLVYSLSRTLIELQGANYGK